MYSKMKAFAVLFVICFRDYKSVKYNCFLEPIILNNPYYITKSIMCH